MGEFVQKLLNNHVLVVSALSWAAAQIIKTFINLLLTKKFEAERLVGAGGMPSAHSAFVCALAVSTANQCGPESAEFAIAFALAAVVIYDAMGVRRAAGEQAKAINDITDMMFKAFPQDDFYVSQLKELLGHTPLEVLAGAILGITIALLL